MKALKQQGNNKIYKEYMSYKSRMFPSDLTRSLDAFFLIEYFKINNDNFLSCPKKK